MHAKKEKKFLFESQITSVDLGIALTRSGHKSFVFVDTEMQKMDRKGEALLDKPAVTALHLSSKPLSEKCCFFMHIVSIALSSRSDFT